MASMKILFAVVSFLSLFSTAKLTTVVDIDSGATYKDGQWTGRVACTFYNQSDCRQSMHVDGHRIDGKDTKSNEDVFVLCFSSTTSIALSISNMTYEDIRDYSCLQETTQQYNHTWLTANPYIEVEGDPTYGDTTLTCNSVPGAPLYWILPGDQQDNSDVQIIDTSSEVNSSTTAIISHYDIRLHSQYKCCIRSKDGQFPLACSSYEFPNDVSQIVYMVSTSCDYLNSDAMTMTCVIQPYVYAPDPSFANWEGCNNSGDCDYMSTSSQFTYITDDTVTTTLKTSYSKYTLYACFYLGTTWHGFGVELGSKSPTVDQTSTDAYYFTEGYAVKLSCLVSSSPQPTFTWNQSKMLEFSNGTEIITSGGDYEIQTIQISASEWQTTLIIYPYDVTIHNNVYTCTAENWLGHDSAQLNTNKGPADMDVKLISNVISTDGTNAIKAICTYKIFPFLPNYHINVITEESIEFKTTASYDGQLEAATIIVNFKANVKQFPVTVECCAFNPFNSTSQIIGRLYIDSSTPTS